MMYLKLLVLVFLTAWGLNLLVFAHRERAETVALGKLLTGAAMLAGAWRLGMAWL